MITSKTINQIYKQCLVSRKERMQPCVSVEGMTLGIHIFNLNRIQNEYNKILLAVTKLPVSLRYSHNRRGEAWIMARTGKGPLGGMSLLTTERLIVMAIALKIIRIVPHEEVPCDIPFVVIDDLRLHRQEMTKPRLQRNWVLVKWKVYS